MWPSSTCAPMTNSRATRALRETNSITSRGSVSTPDDFPENQKPDMELTGFLRTPEIVRKHEDSFSRPALLTAGPACPFCPSRPGARTLGMWGYCQHLGLFIIHLGMMFALRGHEGPELQVCKLMTCGQSFKLPIKLRFNVTILQPQINEQI